LIGTVVAVVTFSLGLDASVLTSRASNRSAAWNIFPVRGVKRTRLKPEFPMRHAPTLTAVLFAMSAAVVAHGNQTVARADGSSAAFEVVSVKPSASADDQSRLTAAPGGRVVGTNVTL